MKKLMKLVTPLVLLMVLMVGCAAAPKGEVKNRYQNTFFEYFDTVITVIGYTDTQEEFDAHFAEIKEEFKRLHELFDIYNSYEGVNNLKTINDLAGVEPVPVEESLMELLKTSIAWYEKTNGKANIAMGSVLRVWSSYREDAEFDPNLAEIPPMELLEEKAQHMDIRKIILDEEAGTVYLEDPNMSLDVGAIAKGYAAELVAQKMKAKGFTNLIISAGGNVRALDGPLDGVRQRWGIGIQNPDETIFTDSASLDTVFGNNLSVVTSGDYQRYYVVDGQKYHHLIDPDTLMPGAQFKAVTVVMEDSGLADFFSTTLFLSTLEEGKEMLKLVEDSYAVWVTHDNEVILSEGFSSILRSGGASGAD